ncbi:MAG: hypothetical protein WBB07_07630 [Mycobacterium sp.]
MTPTHRGAEMPGTGLEQYVRDWRSGPVHTTDVMSPQRADELAATLDLEFSAHPGDPLPPLWHWVYFGDWPPTADLGADGHPRNGHFLPPIPHRRRMFAGGRLRVAEPLLLGEPATRRAALVSTAVKHGKTGELLFVTVRYEFSQDGQLRITEEQDLVYRSDAGSGMSFGRVTEAPAVPSAPWVAEPVTHPALLFRFSALTSNAHRIHYDQPYATGVEGFPGLVVHGPLLAIYMAELARVNSDRRLSEFHFRLQRPVFVGDPIRVQGRIDDDDTAVLTVSSGAGTVHASATAGFA